MKKLWSLAIATIIAAVLIGCSSAGNSVSSRESDVVDQVANIVQSEDEHVLGVKNGSPVAYPTKTYGNAFESFFASPTWKYFVGTKEGPDEDGDGAPDYTEENVDIVEFTGYCTYQNVEVKALIQFTLNKADDTFEATYLSFNDVPQSNLMLYGLIEKAFSEAEDVKMSETSDSQSENTSYMPVTVDDLYNALHANALNANNTYKGKRVELTGYVESIDGEGKYVSVSNGDTWSLDSVMCYIKTADQKNQAATFSKGQYISVCGLITKIGDMMGYYMDIDHFGPSPNNSAGGYQSRPTWCYGAYYDEYGTSSLEFTSNAALTFSVSLYRLAGFDCVGTAQGSQVSFTSDMGINGILTHYDSGMVELKVTTSSFGYISSGETFYFYDTYPMQYQATGSPLDDFVIRGYTYSEAIAQGWGDEFASIADRMGTDGESVTARFYGFIESCDTMYFSRSDLNGFDKDMATLARNAPYAHAGRKFNNDTIRSFFESWKWYRGYIEPDAFQETMLNDYERANKELVMAYEKEMGYK